MARQARAVATRQQIITGAARMFEQSGFEGASLGDIVDGSGTTKGALYFHFRSKDELARVVIEEQHRTSIESVRAVTETGASPLRQLVMLCHEMARQIIHDPVVRAGMRLTLEFGGSSEPAQPYVEWIANAQQIVEHGIELGEITSTVDPASLARFVIGSFTGVQLVSQVLTLRADIEQRVDDMWEYLLPAIATTEDAAELSAIRAARWTPPAEADPQASDPEA
ncbi:ScbR family autoregulator-binding transcription factor [Prescottella equi]|uniref:ScbR family autoregulator-binding transcription factor n=1 Tax=Rhodococcus hoagii TaxID=43767 RepID=UPI000422AC6A|nr:ScbR family autoregulator-binding transcription factor [Prescottella equi]BCN44052.1 TetR family transcriptional regulator [Prescottella equi]BDC72499.1 TetR family transcriptional regulator [Prescottella equi]SUE06088.1 tetr family transcriptional regulator [Prescottella equi]SUE18698.1 tetr family transcriptional regulator [Prescottella equi]